MRKTNTPEQLSLDFTTKPDFSHGKAALSKMLFQAYMKDLQSDNPRRRRKGVKGLESLREFTREAIPVLEKAIKDQDFRVWQAAAAALETLHSDR